MQYAGRRTACRRSRRHLRLAQSGQRPSAGARPKHVPRPQADLTFTPGDTFVLYTDGLIERRGEDIDADLQRLADALARYARHSPEHLADCSALAHAARLLVQLRGVQRCGPVPWLRWRRGWWPGRSGRSRSARGAGSGEQASSYSLSPPGKAVLSRMWWTNPSWNKTHTGSATVCNAQRQLRLTAPRRLGAPC
ncbi:SpoIIE family protein phosphatase [Streptomyces mirabilis]|uniref:SpoIIE family protein phosphatase n=1 Tax=Streptomyces TaxID=1883 RepID=UPI0039A4B131